MLRCDWTLVRTENRVHVRFLFAAAGPFFLVCVALC